MLVSPTPSALLRPRRRGPVNGDECYFWRTTGCHFGDKCRYKHIPDQKGKDRKPWQPWTGFTYSLYGADNWDAHTELKNWYLLDQVLWAKNIYYGPEFIKDQNQQFTCKAGMITLIPQRNVSMKVFIFNQRP